MTYFFEKNILFNSNTPNFENLWIIFKYSYFIKNVSFQKIDLMISAIGNFTFKIRNGRFVEDIFSEKICHDLWKSNHFLKIGKKNVSMEKFYYKKHH